MKKLALQEIYALGADLPLVYQQIPDSQFHTVPARLSGDLPKSTPLNFEIRRARQFGPTRGVIAGGTSPFHLRSLSAHVEIVLRTFIPNPPPDVKNEPVLRSQRSQSKASTLANVVWGRQVTHTSTFLFKVVTLFSLPSDTIYNRGFSKSLFYYAWYIYGNWRRHDQEGREEERGPWTI